MKNSVKIAKELVKLAKMMIADDSNAWQVWSIDCWGNREDGWEFNDRSRCGQIIADSDDEEDGENAFMEGGFVNGGKSNFSFEWYDDECIVTIASGKNEGKMLFEINKEI